MAAYWTAARIAARIVVLEAELAAVDDGILKAIESLQYTLGTGQTRQTVMRQQLTSLQKQRDAIIAELERWQEESDGTGKSFTARPGWG